MDYLTSQRIAMQLKNLDAAVARNDRIAVMMAATAIENLLRSSPAGNEELPLPGFLPHWIQQLIRDQGLSIPALAEAVRAQKVVFRPTFSGSNLGLEISGKF